jgi:hypothetical protein
METRFSNINKRTLGMRVRNILSEELVLVRNACLDLRDRDYGVYKSEEKPLVLVWSLLNI